MASSNNDTDYPDGSGASAAAPPSFVVHEPGNSTDQPAEQNSSPSTSTSPTTTTRQRPISTIAQSFATDLDSMFGLGGPGLSGVDQLSLTVEEKKKNVSTGQSELEELEARLRATEQRMAKISRQSSPARPPPVQDPLHQQQQQQQQQGPSAPYSQAPPPARAAPTLPPGAAAAQAATQGKSREDYVMVDRGGVR